MSIESDAAKWKSNVSRILEIDSEGILLTETVKKYFDEIASVFKKGTFDAENTKKQLRALRARNTRLSGKPIAVELSSFINITERYATKTEDAFASFAKLLTLSSTSPRSHQVQSSRQNPSPDSLDFSELEELDRIFSELDGPANGSPSRTPPSRTQPNPSPRLNSLTAYGRQVQQRVVENPFADEVEKKSKAPWVIGIILLLLGILLGCIYLNNNNGGVMTDSRDGKKYKTVKIGSQIWMAENLAYETPYSWDIVSEKTGRHYGRAYPWQVALKACPEGWHLPSGKEFLNLLEFLGGRDNSETGKKLLPRTFFGRINVTGFDAQMVGNHFFHMIYPNRRRYSFDDCYRSKRCKNLNPDDEYIDENEEKDAVFWTSDLDNDCPYDVGCGPLPKIGSYLRIEPSGKADVWSGFGDGYDWIGTPIRCLKN